MSQNQQVPVNLRAATTADLDRLFDIHRDASKDVVEATWGKWDEVWQAEYFKKKFDPGTRQIITCDAEDIGFFEVVNEGDKIFIQNIVISPAFQNRGIGTGLIRNVLREAGKKNLPVRLQVLKVNARARDLYERLGFVITGETETHYKMRFVQNNRE